MKAFTDLENPLSIKNPILTIGTFDGVHVGHQTILNQINKIADEVGGESTLFTFHPHPRMVLFPDDTNLKLIQTQGEKLEKLERFGLKNIVRYPFTKEFSRLTATEFVRDFLVNKIGVHTVVIGYDHQFGRNRQGTLEVLHELSEVYGFNVEEISAQTINEVNVSSTKIRRAIEKGEMEVAAKYLGEPFVLTAVVGGGKKIGRTIGFPTANLTQIEKHKILPGVGVYLVKVKIEGEVYYGMLNNGNRPTIDNDSASVLEVHIFDFEKEIYNHQIQVQFLKKIRNEVKFESKAELSEQLTKDEENCRNLIEHFSMY